MTSVSITFEDRSWRGFHHHLALAATADLFVLLVFLRAKKNFLPHVEEALRRIRPFSIRSRGFCPFCNHLFHIKPPSESLNEVILEQIPKEISEMVTRGLWQGAETG